MDTITWPEVRAFYTNQETRSQLSPQAQKLIKDSLPPTSSELDETRRMTRRVRLKIGGAIAVSIALMALGMVAAFLCPIAMPFPFVVGFLGLVMSGHELNSSHRFFWGGELRALKKRQQPPNEERMALIRAALEEKSS